MSIQIGENPLENYLFNYTILRPNYCCGHAGQFGTIIFPVNSEYCVYVLHKVGRIRISSVD